MKSSLFLGQKQSHLSAHLSFNNNTDNTRFGGAYPCKTHCYNAIMLDRVLQCYCVARSGLIIFGPIRDSTLKSKIIFTSLDCAQIINLKGQVCHFCANRFTKHKCKNNDCIQTGFPNSQLCESILTDKISIFSSSHCTLNIL